MVRVSKLRNAEENSSATLALERMHALAGGGEAPDLPDRATCARSASAAFYDDPLRAVRRALAADCVEGERARVGAHLLAPCMPATESPAPGAGRLGRPVSMDEDLALFSTPDDVTSETSGCGPPVTGVASPGRDTSPLLGLRVGRGSADAHQPAGDAGAACLPRHALSLPFPALPATYPTPRVVTDNTGDGLLARATAVCMWLPCLSPNRSQPERVRGLPSFHSVRPCRWLNTSPPLARRRRRPRGARDSV